MAVKITVEISEEAYVNLVRTVQYRNKSNREIRKRWPLSYAFDSSVEDLAGDIVESHAIHGDSDGC